MTELRHFCANFLYIRGKFGQISDTFEQILLYLGKFWFIFWAKSNFCTP